MLQAEYLQNLERNFKLQNKTISGLWFSVEIQFALKYFAQTFEMAGKFRTSAVASFFKNCTIRKIRQQIGDSSSIKKRRRKNQIYCYAKKLQKQNRIFFCKARQNREKNYFTSICKILARYKRILAQVA